MSVSVVIPCYNGMPYLCQALDSALAQTLRPVEVIVVDDGSKDDSAATVRRYEKESAGLVHLVPQANAGEPAARNAGIRHSRGDWVAMLDADDWWDPRKLELQAQAAIAAGPDCVLVHTGGYKHLPDGTVVESDLAAAGRRTGWCTQALLEPVSIGHPSIMIRRTALEEIGGYDPAFRQSCDIDLYFRLSAVGTFAFVPQHLLHYRVHERQMSSSQIDQIPFHHKAVHKFFADHPDMEARIGPAHIQGALARHVEVKLESLYWKRHLTEFRKLLAYAHENHLDSPAIARWRRKARWPDWVVNLKERLIG